MAVAADEDFADTVAEIVQHLDQDPVLVEEVMGNGHTDEIAEALSAKAAHSPVPVHVVLTKAPAGLTTRNTADELLTLLHARSEEDGVWFVATADNGQTAMAVYGDLDPAVDNDETALSMAVDAADDEVTQAIRSACTDCYSTPVIEAGLVLDTLVAGLPADSGSSVLDAQQVEGYATSTWWGSNTRTFHPDDAEMPTPGLYAVVATVTALCVAVIGYRLLMALVAKVAPAGGFAATTRSPSSSAGKQKTPRGPRAELHRWQAKARSQTRRLETELGSAEGMDDPGDWQRRDLATACLERAQSRVASADLLEVVGALVLARTGIHALSDKPGQYRCCYVDPRHGSAITESPLGGGISVPVCGTCAKAMRKDVALEPLTEKSSLGGHRPYYEGSTLWAENGFGALGGDWWKQVPR